MFIKMIQQISADIHFHPKSKINSLILQNQQNFTAHQEMKFNRLIKIALFIIIVLFAYSLWQRVPDIDDAWIGEHAYWLSEKGYVKSELMHGITNQQERHIVHHKLFTLNGLAFIKMFGFSLYTLKSVSLLWLVIFMGIFYRYASKKAGNNIALLGIFLLMVNSLIFQYSFVYRPEIMVMTLGFCSFICLEKYLDQGKMYLLILSGLFAGLAASAHLNGLIFIGAGCFVLLSKKKAFSALLLAVFSIPGLAIYFYDFTSKYDLAYWFYQMNDSPALNKSSAIPSSLAYLLKILREHLRFFHSPKEIIFSILFIFSIIASFKKLKSKTILLHYVFSLIILLSLISVHSTSKYLLLYIPYMILIILFSFGEMYKSYSFSSWHDFKYNKLIVTAGILILLYLGIHTGYDIQLSTRKYDTHRNEQYTDKYFSHHTSQKAILAPMEFIFNEIPKYERIQSDLSIQEMEGTRQIGQNTFFQIMDTLKIDDIILSEEYMKKFGLLTMNHKSLKQKGFKTIGKEEGYTFITRIQ